MVYFDRDNNVFTIPVLRNASENKWSLGSIYHEIKISFSIHFQFFLLKKKWFLVERNGFLQLLLLLMSLNQSDNRFHVVSTNKLSPFKQKLEHFGSKFCTCYKMGESRNCERISCCFDLVLMYIIGDNDLN